MLSTRGVYGGELYNGCLFSCIITAVMTPKLPNIDFMHSWDELTYRINDGSGTRGAITFMPGLCVGAFSDANSPLNPLYNDLSYTLDAFFVGAPERVITAAQNEALLYLKDQYIGVSQPIITSAFWLVGDIIEAAVPWVDVINNGAHVIEQMLLPVNESIDYWREGYQMTDDEVELALQLYDVRRTELRPPPPHTIDEALARRLMASVTTVEINDSVTETLSEIGLIIPSV